MSLSVMNEGSRRLSQTQRFTSRARKALTAGPRIHSPHPSPRPHFLRPQKSIWNMKLGGKSMKGATEAGAGLSPGPHLDRRAPPGSHERGSSWLPSPRGRGRSRTKLERGAQELRVEETITRAREAHPPSYSSLGESLTRTETRQ